MDIEEISRVISKPRFKTYLDAAGGNIDKAKELYSWNLEISSAFMVPLSICEIVIRNSVVDALTATHGKDWFKSTGFQKSLRDNVRGDFLECVRKHKVPGQIIAKVKFRFWQSMFTKSQKICGKYTLIQYFPIVRRILVIRKELNIYMVKLNISGALETELPIMNRFSIGAIKPT